MSHDPEKQRMFYQREPEVREALIRIGEATASLGVWRDLMIEGGEPTMVDGELRAFGCFKLTDARRSLKLALEQVEALIARHPDILPGSDEVRG